ncbi:MAG TPA: MarR family transcriptional regulator [Steroidobacteraceae bacterium]|nr:MarR family transcriptional regulator [Steroidobacteraceae bacterium]
MLTAQLVEIDAGINRVAAKTDGVLPVESAMLFRTLILLGRELTQVLEGAIRPFGLNETEYRVLMILFSQPDGMGHPTELCAGAAQSPANMTRLIDSLVARRLVGRSPGVEDRRRTALQITPAGDALVRQVLPHLANTLRNVFNMGGAEQRQLIAHLQGIATTMDSLDRSKVA